MGKQKSNGLKPLGAVSAKSNEGDFWVVSFLVEVGYEVAIAQGLFML